MLKDWDPGKTKTQSMCLWPNICNILSRLTHITQSFLLLHCILIWPAVQYWNDHHHDTSHTCQCGRSQMLVITYSDINGLAAAETDVGLASTQIAVAKSAANKLAHIECERVFMIAVNADLTCFAHSTIDPSLQSLCTETVWKLLPKCCPCAAHGLWESYYSQTSLTLVLVSPLHMERTSST